MVKDEANSLNKPTTKLQKLRMKRGFTQAQMAQLMGINKRSYITLEKSNSIHKREITQIIKLCVILQCSIAEIIDDTKIIEDLRFAAYQETKRAESDFVPESQRDQRAITKKLFE